MAGVYLLGSRNISDFVEIILFYVFYCKLKIKVEIILIEERSGCVDVDILFMLLSVVFFVVKI